MKQAKFIMHYTKTDENPLPEITSPELAAKFNQANELLNQKRISEALTGYTELQHLVSPKQELPLHIYVNYYLGIALKELLFQKDEIENLRKVIAAFEEALRYLDNLECFEQAAIYNEYGSTLISLADFTDMEDKDKRIADGIQAFHTALNLLEKSFENYPPQEHPREFAFLCKNLGNTYLLLAEWEQCQENLAKAIVICEKALTVITAGQTPSNYALVQYNLGFACDALSEYLDPDINQTKAIAAYKAAIEVYLSPGFSFEYAHTQNCLASLYIDIAQVKEAENYLNMAIEVCKEILNVVKTASEYPFCYASILHNLGSACKIYYKSRGQEAYLEKAIHYFLQVLKIGEVAHYSRMLASTHLNLGMIYSQLADGHGSEYLFKAVDSYENTLKFLTPLEFPLKYAVTQINLGKAYQALVQQYPNARGAPEHILKAVEAFQGALDVFNPEEYPEDYADTQFLLGNAMLQLTQISYQERNFNRTIEYLKEALKSFNIHTNPVRFKKTIALLGDACQLFAQNQKQDDIFFKVVQNYERAIRGYTKDRYPVEYAKTHVRLGQIYLAFSKNSLNRDAILNKAIEIFTEVLEFCILELFPEQYAETHENLGYAYMELAQISEKTPLLNMAAQSLEEALRVYTLQSHPESYGRIQNSMGKIQLELGGGLSDGADPAGAGGG